MGIEKQIPTLEEILVEWQSIIGIEYQGYKNHVYRIVNFCFALKECRDEEKQKICIAAAFHDLGMWSDNTFDYIEPSISNAQKYLKKIDHEEWGEEISLMISEHHKIGRFHSSAYPLVEIFREADLIDLSLGLFKFCLSFTLIKNVKKQFPNCGFHAGIGKKALRWSMQHPFNPVPMMKW